jgi:hypothetical protein
MFKLKNFVIIELSLIVVWFVLNYFFGDTFRSAIDICLRHTGRTDCYMRPEGFLEPLYLTLINMLAGLLFFVYLIVFLVERIVKFFRKSKITT